MKCITPWHRWAKPTLWLICCWPVLALGQTEVNTASQAELETIKGLGPGLSEAIIVQRRDHPFESWQDLISRISGVGKSRASKLSDAGLMVAGQTWPQFRAKTAASNQAKHPERISSPGRAQPIADTAPPVHFSNPTPSIRHEQDEP